MPNASVEPTVGTFFFGVLAVLRRITEEGAELAEVKFLCPEDAGGGDDGGNWLNECCFEGPVSSWNWDDTLHDLLGCVGECHGCILPTELFNRDEHGVDEQGEPPTLTAVYPLYLSTELWEFYTKLCTLNEELLGGPDLAQALAGFLMVFHDSAIADKRKQSVNRLLGSFVAELFRVFPNIPRLVPFGESELLFIESCVASAPKK